MVHGSTPSAHRDSAGASPPPRFGDAGDATVPPRDITIPQRVGHFEIVREIGSGGMARVFEARHETLGKRAAVKMLHAHIASNATAAARFLDEGKAAADIRHPHVVNVFDFGMERGVPYLVMDLVEGESLRAHLAAHAPLPLEDVVDILLPIISAVSAAHAFGVIHRDLKPENVLLSRTGAVRPSPIVLDFGIHKRIKPDEDHVATAPGVLLGTLPYVPPELTRGGSSATPAADQYSVGVMLYECATGKRPFDGATTYDLLHAIALGKYVPPSSLDARIPPAFDALVARAMHLNASERFPSMNALGSALLSFASRRAWNLWGDELARGGGARASANAGATLSTEPEVASPVKAIRTNSRAVRWRRAAIASAVAATATLLVVTSGLSKTSVSPLHEHARTLRTKEPAVVRTIAPSETRLITPPEPIAPATAPPRRKPPAHPATPPPVQTGTNGIPIFD
jgi:serine/threonine-protein kinase